MHPLRSTRRFAVRRITPFFRGLLRKSNAILLWPPLLALFFYSGSCNESLPPYDEPQRLFDATVTGDYTLTASDNSMKVYVTVRNTFDETLQARFALGGEVDIVSARDPSVRKTFFLTPGIIMSIPGYDPRTGILTIDPGGTVSLGISWDLVDDSGNDLRASFFRYVEDPACSLRCLAYAEDFVLSGNVQLLERTGPVLFGPVVYSLCFVSQWINPKLCPPIITGEPCSVRAPKGGVPCYPFEPPD